MDPLGGPERQDSWLRLEDASAIGAARRMATALAQDRGFDDEHAGQVAVAVSEAASNLVKHARVGMMLIRPHPGVPGTIEVISIDSGPGMSDTVGPIRDGYSTTGTLGIGLGAITRLSDFYDIYSVPGKGTVLSMQFTARGATGPDSMTCGLGRPVGDEIVSGDAFAFQETADTVTAIVCDGLGHGVGAAEASREAVRVFRADPEVTPLSVIERTHRALGHTRGGAVAAIRIDRRARAVTYAGIGNISGWIVTPTGRQGLLSLPGIAGHNARHLRETRYELPPHAVVVMHSDGLTERWDLAAYPGLLRHSAHVIAGTLFRDSAIRRDDASVLVIRTGP
ncbi:transcriptional regulator [Sphaerisporangium krabiense]|uniref:Anti-sigma regulatory factor (Ser/Thr protein kinase) n=1 Tax=Sphaerisporangium krabiense TaxID=763782 RepID=A0A7W8Z7K0_9ACTN|nr:SpoIIE family protein phosphatase [Sphaerisporangium krabiense]MBB5628710.1 anti-sigma regulatory factor (Ser/Thr protein kinase) [Sphaerisporangium krabiense]GII60450.1 transcriptional regulator [Sphaerisporangium krabiense]